MYKNRTANQIATSVFKALPRINKVWVDVEAQLFHLHSRQGGILMQRSDVMPPEPVSTQHEADHQFEAA